MITEQIHPPPVRTSSRPAANFDLYVLAYARQQRNNVLLSVTGIGIITGAGIYLRGAQLVLLLSFGLGLALAGLAAMAIAARAHDRYTEHLATATVTTYADAPPAAAVRAFIASTNGAPTIRAGKFRLSRAQWERLFQTAGDNGKLTRDNAMKALPRELYRDWSGTLAELERLGIVDGTGIITGDGWQWYKENVSPFPEGMTAQSRVPGTHARGARPAPNTNGAGVAS